MRHFLMFLNNEMKKRYPEICFEFYLPKWKKNVHMGIDISLMNYTNCLKIVSDIKDIWISKKTNNGYKFVNPKLILITKCEFDYTIFSKNV